MKVRKKPLKTNGKLKDLDLPELYQRKIAFKPKNK